MVRARICAVYHRVVCRVKDVPAQITNDKRDEQLRASLVRRREILEHHDGQKYRN